MGALLQNRALIVVLLATVALSGCDLFSNKDDETPTTPLLANVVLVGSASVQTSTEGFAEYLGQVVNTGSVAARNVRVSVNIYDGSSNLIDVATTTSVPAELQAQATGTFKVTSATLRDQAATFQVVIEWD
ncbi:MAG: FxLYD domain-containing protein [Acidobacteriota bacterium]|jgi:hypothetical protein